MIFTGGAFMQKTTRYSILCAGMLCVTMAATGLWAVSVDSLKFTGWGAFEAGQILHGFYGSSELNHKWQERFSAQLTVDVPVSERLQMVLSGECAYQYSVLETQTNGPSLLPAVSFYLNQADLRYIMLTGENPVTLQAGYFPFKYHDATRNLGEYLFRSGCYPNYITNNFDFALNRLLGVNVESTLFGHIRQNLLLTSEVEVFPTQDFSITYLVSVTALDKAIELGGGVCGQRILSVNDKRTTQHSPKTISEIKNIQQVIDPNGIPITTGDTTFYSFAGTKLMAHMTIDPKPLFNIEFFGKEDLKVYGEIAILGLKNYPMYLDSTIRFDILKERIPIMFGINLPAFKIFDVLVLEAEYYNNRYTNSYYSEAFDLLPLPYISGHGLDSSAAGNWKWSVYAKKKLGNNLLAVVQFARDHRRAPLNMSDPRYCDFGDNMFSDKDWYYLGKLVYGF
jgi:hypothetical protein